MDSKSILLFFLLFAYPACATNVPADFHGTGDVSGLHFTTDMSFTTNFYLELKSGAVVDGEADNLQNGDTVCSGSVVTAYPSSSSKWATSSDLQIVGLYPYCGSYCPAMIGYSTVNTNKDVRWLSSSIYTNHKSFGDVNDFSQDISRYNELSTFHTQKVTYNNASGEFHANKEGGANVFCNGNLEVWDGTSVKSSNSPGILIISGGTDIPLNSAGSHAISTRLQDVKCFGAMVKHPLNTADHTDYFYLDYFTHNQPSIDDSIAIKTITINVQEDSGTCEMHETSVTASGSMTSEDNLMIKVRMQNDGDPIRVTSVTSSNADYTVTAFPISMCDILGFPSSLCPDSNGFNSTITEGGSKDLYVLLVKGAGASGGTTLNFQAATLAAACGGAVTCSEAVSLAGAMNCEITPSSLTYGTNEVAEFTVECLDLGDDPIACIGSNWAWSDLDGGFVEKDNEHALAYTTSPPGSSGSLTYSSGMAHCHSDIDVIAPTYECELLPPTAELNYSQSQDFILNCWETGNPATPDDATYDLIDGLDGSLSDESTTGATYTAPDSDTEGKLQGIGLFDSAPSPIIGAIAFAQITVTSGTGGNDTNDTNHTGHNDDGSSEWCTIGGSGLLDVFPGYSGWVGIKCGPTANETCDSVSWSMVPYEPVLGFLYGENNNGTSFTITGEPGNTVKIRAIIGGDPHQDCFKSLNILEPWCWQFS